MDDDFPADQPVAVAGEVSLAADEVILVDPFPRPRLEMVAHPVAIHQIHDQRSAGGERAFDRLEHGEIVLRALEIAERVAEDADAMKLAIAETKTPGITLVKRDLQVALPGALAGETDQIARAVEPGDVRKPAAGELERVTTLAAAQIENAVVALKADRCGSRSSTSSAVLRSFSITSPSVSR